MQKGAADLADTIEGNVDSSVDLMTNEPTPQETRAKLDAMAGETLTRLFVEQPEAADLFELERRLWSLRDRGSWFFLAWRPEPDAASRSHAPTTSASI